MIKQQLKEGVVGGKLRLLSRGGPNLGPPRRGDPKPFSQGGRAVTPGSWKTDAEIAAGVKMAADQKKAGGRAVTPGSWKTDAEIAAGVKMAADEKKAAAKGKKTAKKKMMKESYLSKFIFAVCNKNYKQADKYLSEEINARLKARISSHI